jgi:hypothetical protein
MSETIPAQTGTPGGRDLRLRFRSFFAQEFFHSALIQWVSIGSLFLNAINWGLIAFFIRPVDFPIILHYNVYFGVDLIGPWWQVYFLPLTGLLILTVNAIVGYKFYGIKERTATHLLMLATFIAQVALTIAVASLIVINY